MRIECDPIMKKIVLVWELGGGIGHLAMLRCIAEALLEHGCEMTVISRDVGLADRIFHPLCVRLLQAPLNPPMTGTISPMLTFGHILHNIGFGDAAALAITVRAWRQISKELQPDAVIFDHSPTALLASRGESFARLTVGTGFFLPPLNSPLGPFEAWDAKCMETLRQDEVPALHAVNKVLTHTGRTSLEHLSDLYRDTNDNLLCTYPELDHYGPRVGAKYYGANVPPPGIPPDWPAVPGPRVFAYLKPTEDYVKLLSALDRLGFPTLVSCMGIPSNIYQQFTTPALRFAAGPVDMRRVATECDIGITNGSHSTTIDLLLAGKPIIQVPLTREQLVVAQNTHRLGGGIILLPDARDHLDGAVRHVLYDPSYAIAAGGFAVRHRYLDPKSIASQILSYV
jgi:hypothetical protein